MQPTLCLVQTSFKQINGSIQDPRLPTPDSKHAAPSARFDWSSGLHKELLSVTDVQTYGLQHVPFILYLVSKQRSPLCLSQTSAVVDPAVVDPAVVDPEVIDTAVSPVDDAALVDAAVVDAADVEAAVVDAAVVVVG